MLRGLNQAATDIQQMVSEEVGTPAEMLESAEENLRLRASEATLWSTSTLHGCSTA